MFHAYQLQQELGAKLIGEPTGGKPWAWGLRRPIQPPLLPPHPPVLNAVLQTYTGRPRLAGTLYRSRPESSGLLRALRSLGSHCTGRRRNPAHQSLRRQSRSPLRSHRSTNRGKHRHGQRLGHHGPSARRHARRDPAVCSRQRRIVEYRPRLRPLSAGRAKCNPFGLCYSDLHT